MTEILTVRLPKGARRKIEKAARARDLTVSQYVRQALDVQKFLDLFESARGELLPRARKRGVFSDEDVFRIVS